MLNSIKYLLILLITLSFFSCDSDNTSILSPPVNDTKPVWPQVGYNGRHTGNRYGINVNIPPVQSGNIFWLDTVTTSWPNDGSESSIDALGNIYFRFSAAYEGHIIKFRPDGTRIWEKDTLHNDCYNGFAFSNDESRIYYSDWYKTTCRDSSGNLIWSIPEGNYFGNIPCVGKDGTIYTALGNDLGALSPEGNIKWRLIETDVSTCWPALDRDDNVYVQNRLAANQFELLKIDKNGLICYRYSLTDWIFSVVIDGYNNIYYRDSEKLVSLNEKGDIKWVKVIPGQEYCHVVPAITTENKIIIDSAINVVSSAVVCLDTSGKTLWVKIISNSGYIEPYMVLDDQDNIYFNHWHNVSRMAVCSLDKFGNFRWQSIDPALGWVLPGLTLSPLGMLFDTPKRPNVVFTLK